MKKTRDNCVTMLRELPGPVRYLGMRMAAAAVAMSALSAACKVRAPDEYGVTVDYSDHPPHKKTREGDRLGVAVSFTWYGGPREVVIITRPEPKEPDHGERQEERR